MTRTMPESLISTCASTPERKKWLEMLPKTLDALARRWAVELGKPFDGEEVSCSWVSLARRADSSTAILKIGMPHMEADDEADGLRFWNGDPTVRLLEFDRESGGMLIERCVPGTPLRSLPEPEQDVIVAGLLRRLWRKPPSGAFRTLAVMLSHWSSETLKRRAEWPDGGPDDGLVTEGLNLFRDLSHPSDDDVLLATDLHAGNVLRAGREPWLVIDPKPFVGDRAYDATQHLLNCDERMETQPHETIARFADLAGLDRERVRLWMFARAAAELRDESRDDSREDWQDARMLQLARALAP